MRKSFPKEDDSFRETSDIDKYLGNLDLLNLRLNFPTAENTSQTPLDNFKHSEQTSNWGDNLDPTVSVSRRRQFHPLHHSRQKLSTPNIDNVPQGYAQSRSHFLPSSNHINKNLISTERINQHDFLFPSKKKSATTRVIDIGAQTRMTNSDSKSSNEDCGSFPFKSTPSGNLKINSHQVVFSSNKLSVLVADPQNTKVNIRQESVPMARVPTEFSKTSAMDTIISQAGFSSLGSLIGNTPVRPGNKEASEYESKQTSEILDPELNLGRLGYSGTDSISWDKVILPEKKNLYLELYSRITNYTNADCKVYIDNEEFNCHLIVLQCYSELFDAYIAVKKVEIPSEKCSAASFAFIYEWMITGEPSYRDLNRENVLDIFNSAKYLKIKDLVEQCWAFIDNTDVFNEDTAFLLYMDAKKKSLPEVRELMLPRIQGFFLMLVSSQDWLELELDDMKCLLKSNYICVNCEMEIFMAAVRWLKHDWVNRDYCKYDVLDCVRFGNIAPWQLVDIKRNPENPDFMELAKDARICKMIDDGLAFVIIKYWYGQENDDFQHWNTVLGLQEPPARNWSGSDKTYFTYREFLIYLDQYRRNQLIEKNKPKIVENKFSPELLVKSALPGGGDKASPRVPTMDEFLSKKKFCELLRNSEVVWRRKVIRHKKEHKAAQIIQRAYRKHRKRTVEKEVQTGKIISQKNFGKKTSILDLFKLNSVHNQLKINRSYSSPLLDKYLTERSLFRKESETVLVLGGIDPHSTYGVGRNTGKNIFRYSPNNNNWVYVGDLPEPRYQHSAVFLGERIYLIGGCDPREDHLIALNSVWSFDPAERYWYREPAMNVPRKLCGLVACNRSIYAIGGKAHNQECLRSMEKFNVIQGFWELKAPMINSRIGGGYAKYGNYIWAVGGLTGLKRNTVLSAVESYNIKTDQWTEVTSLNFPRCFACLYVMIDKMYIVGGAGKLNPKQKFSCSLGAIEMWNVATSSWDHVTELSIPRHSHSIAYLGTQMFVIGGVTSLYRRALSNNEVFCCQRGAFVRGVSCLPVALSGHAAASLPPAIILSMR